MKDIFQVVDELIAELQGKGAPRPTNPKSIRTDKNYIARIDERGEVELTYILRLESGEEEYR